VFDSSELGPDAPAEALPDLPPLLQPLAGDPDFERLMVELAKAKPKAEPAKLGVRGPNGVIPDAIVPKMRCVVIITDVHVPDNDKPLWKAFLKFVADLLPDEIVLGGDFLELESCSQHAGANLIMYAHDVDAGNAALDALQSASPATKVTYLEGNHETRLSRFLSSKAPTLMGSLGLPAALRLDARGIDWVPEDQQPIARGDLDILHGHQMGTGKAHSLPKYHSNRAIEVYGRPGRTVTYGHTHKPQRMTLPSVGGNKRAVGLGCGRTLKPGWLHGSEAGWEHEFGLAYIHPNGQTDYYQLKVVNGVFVWAGHVYDGNA
jgi:predicted phosphodiesterase